MLPKYMIRLNKIRITYLAVLSKILATSVKVRSRSFGQDLLGRPARATKGGCFLTWPMPELLSIKCAIFCFGELPREKLSSLYISFKSFQSWWWVCWQWMASAVAMASSLSPLPFILPHENLWRELPSPACQALRWIVDPRLKGCQSRLSQF